MFFYSYDKTFMCSCQGFLKHMGAFLSNRLVDRDGLSLFPGLRRESGGNVMQQQNSVRAGRCRGVCTYPSPIPRALCSRAWRMEAAGAHRAFGIPCGRGRPASALGCNSLHIPCAFAHFYRFYAVWGRNSGARFTARQSPCYNLTKAREERFGKRCRIGRIRNFWRRPWRRWNRAFFSWRRATP